MINLFEKKSINFQPSDKKIFLFFGQRLKPSDKNATHTSRLFGSMLNGKIFSCFRFLLEKIFFQRVK